MSGLGLGFRVEGSGLEGAGVWLFSFKNRSQSIFKATLTPNPKL